MSELGGLLNPVRGKNEPYAVYRERRKAGSKQIKKYLRGRPAKVSSRKKIAGF